MYVGSPCPVVPYDNKTSDFAMIASLRLGMEKKTRWNNE